MASRRSIQGKWRKLILTQQASGLNPGVYCSKENICRTSFYAWRKRLRLMPGEPTSALLHDAGCENSVSGHERKGFMQVVAPEQEVSSVIRVELPNGYRVAMDYKDKDLKQLLELLRCM